MLGQKLKRRLTRYGLLRGTLAEGTSQDIARVRAAATKPEAASETAQTEARRLINALPKSQIDTFRNAFDPKHVRAGHYKNATSLHLFVHIPKTAGSALLFGLRDGFEAVTPIPYDRAPDALADAMQSLNSVEQVTRSHVLIGHFNWRAAYTFFRDNSGLRAASMIRNPADRLLSQYLYNGSKAHPAHLEFRARFPKFQTYLDTVSPNFQLQQMAGNGDFSRRLFRLGRYYTFLGVTEHFGASLAHYSRSHALPEMREHVVNVAAKTPWQDVELTTELREEIYLKHAQDWALYSLLEPMFRGA
ncbi:MAG: hypothetical protein ACRBCL_05205 [Maritimibacter sp.]